MPETRSVNGEIDGVHVPPITHLIETKRYTFVIHSHIQYIYLHPSLTYHTLLVLVLLLIISINMAAKTIHKAAFGGGCFWGMEKWFRKEVSKIM